MEDYVKIKAIVPYAGGKSKVSDFLTGMFPPHTAYVDMFCGMLSVFLAKPRRSSKMEWLNDKYNVLVNFLTVIQERPDEFVAYYKDKLIVDSEWLYYKHITRLRQPIDIPDVEAAVCFWTTQHQSFTGRNAVTYPSYASHGGSSAIVHAEELPIADIMALHSRLRGVKIYNRDFRDMFGVIARHEGGDREFFVFEDPPYWDCTGGRDYAERFSWRDHQDLADINARMKGKFLLTINKHDDIIRLYEGVPGVRIRPYSIMYTASNKPAEGNARAMAEELLISNYETTTVSGPLFAGIEIVQGENEE